MQELKFQNLIDIRCKDEWKNGILEGSKLITFFDENGKINPNFKQEVEANFNKNDKITLLCHSGYRSKFGIKFLQDCGFSDVCDVEFGIEGLVKKGTKLVKFEG